MDKTMTVDKMMKALEALRHELGDLGMQQILILLAVFKNDGITQLELQERLDMKQGTVSKNCRRFAFIEIADPKTGEMRMEGMDIIRLVPSVEKFRQLECQLTGRGKAIRTKFMEVLT